MRVAKDEENGLDAAKKTFISPAYCTIVHSSYGSWACVFFPLYHTLSAISPFPFSCMLVRSLSFCYTPFTTSTPAIEPVSAFYTLTCPFVFSQLLHFLFLLVFYSTAEMSSNLTTVCWS